MTEKNIIRDRLLRNHLPSNFVSRKIMEYEDRIALLENKINTLTDLVRTDVPVITTKAAHYDIVSGMNYGCHVSIKQILFPEWLQCERTQRTYMAELVALGYVKMHSSGKYRRYEKLKDFESDK